MAKLSVLSVGGRVLRRIPNTTSIAFHSMLGCTPAVGLKLAAETWTIEGLIEEY